MCVWIALHRSLMEQKQLKLKQPTSSFIMLLDIQHQAINLSVSHKYDAVSRFEYHSLMSIARVRCKSCSVTFQCVSSLNFHISTCSLVRPILFAQLSQNFSPVSSHSISLFRFLLDFFRGFCSLFHLVSQLMLSIFFNGQSELLRKKTKFARSHFRYLHNSFVILAAECTLFPSFSTKKN